MPSYVEPQFAPWDGRRVPLTFLAGYLGAGKTTLLNAMLADSDRPIAVLVNDIGDVSIDERLIEKRSGDTIELAGGCVCCSLVDGFGAAFDHLRARDEPPEHVVVELSGVAEPSRMLPWGKSAGFRLDGVFTVVAADQVVELLDTAAIGPLVAAQIVDADVIGVSKLDLVDEATEVQVRDRIQELAPDASIVSADPDAAARLLTMGGRQSGGVADLPTPTLFDRHRVESVALSRPIDFDSLNVLLDGLGDDVMRAKGVAELPDGTLILIQVVGRRRSLTALPEVEGEGPTDLVVISL